MRRAALDLVLISCLLACVAAFQEVGAAAPPGAMPQTSMPAQPQQPALPKFDGDLVSPTWGGRIESTTLSDTNHDTNMRALGGPGAFMNQVDRKPTEFVLSFFERDKALVDQVALVMDGSERRWVPQDIEIWTSATGPAEGFVKAASATLAKDAWKPIPAGLPGYVRYPHEDGSGLVEASVKFAPVEARFVKLRVLRSIWTEEPFFFKLWKIRVLEAQGPGYVPMLTRHPEIYGPFEKIQAGAAPPPVPAPAAPACVPVPDTPPKPGHGESRKVLHISPRGDPQDPWYSPTVLTGLGKDKRPVVAALGDTSILDRMTTTFVSRYRAQPFMLSDKSGFDTVVLQLPCEGIDMSPFFKQALVTWVAAGHKLIIHDSDKCEGGNLDYGFLPFRFKTDNPGARGASGKAMRNLEDNWMITSRRQRPGFVDTAAWEADPRANELGDSNVVTTWDANLCGQMAVQNDNGVFGFVLTYAHLGRGLVIWDGLDVDMRTSGWYDQVVARELAQGFDPDNLPCSVKVGSFAITTEPRLLARAAQPGQTITYPLSLLSNLKYKGTVNLTAAASPAIAGFQARFEPATVAVSTEQKATMTLTLPAGMKPAPFAVEVKGTATDGKTNSLCLQLGPPKSGELAIVSALSPTSKTRKNLEVILDASGSMKSLMGKKSRWATALDTLQQVLATLPDDFNVGLRIYGHREPSTSPKTCTDSELVVPIEKLNRQRILDSARRYQPKGETPLVYSALQAPADLKAVGGGTVILITDGEESCKGDPVKAAAELNASGLDIRLSIVGFAVANPKTQQDLAGFAQGTGGLFYAAKDGAALGDALLAATTEKFPYSVYDAAGKAVLTSVAGGGGDEIPPGTYRVVAKAGTREVVAPRVSVALGQSVTLRIALKGGKLVLE